MLIYGYLVEGGVVWSAKRNTKDYNRVIDSKKHNTFKCVCVHLYILLFYLSIVFVIRA